MPIIRQIGNGRPAWSDCLVAVKAMSGLAPALVMGDGRRADIIAARRLLVYLAHEYARMSYPEIAAAMGKRSHTGPRDSGIAAEQQINEAAMAAGV